MLTGLTEPTTLRFSPDGRVFVAEKGGLVKVFDSLSDPSPSIFADLRTNVHSFDDRGMLGMALHPSFPSVPHVYVSYAHDAAIGGTAPRWGVPDTSSDGCPTPPGPTLDGCVISSRLSRLTAPTTGGGSYSAAVLADSPRGYWRLGEASGTTATDASGNGRVGTYVDTPSLGQPGALLGDSSTSVGFNGSSEYATVPYSASLNTATTTLEAWAYVTGGQGQYRAVVSNRDFSTGSTRGSILYASSGNHWQFWVGTGGGTWSTVTGPTVALNQWTHVVGTYDGTRARLFVDGVETAPVTTSHVPNSARPLRVAAGANEQAPQFLFPGRVDEVAVYASALSAGRVQAHFGAGSGSAALAPRRCSSRTGASST